MVSLKNSTKRLKKWMSILHNLFQKIAEEGTLPSSLYKASFTLIPKPDRQYKKTPQKNKKNPHKLQTNISQKFRCHDLNKILTCWIQQYIRTVYHDQVEFNPHMQGWFNIKVSVYSII